MLPWYDHRPKRREIMEYHKIPTAWARDPATRYKTLVENEWATPELKFLKDAIWQWTEKVDGTNIRIHWDGYNFEIGGRTDNAQIPAFLLKELMLMFTVESLSKVFPVEDVPLDLTLYGEGYGAKIQKGGGNYLSDTTSFVLFDVRVGKWWLTHDAVEDIATKMQIGRVPDIGYGTLNQMIEKARAGFNSIWGDFEAEGIIARPGVELQDRSGRRIITKIKCRDFK
jgi:hypothetical protein